MKKISFLTTLLLMCIFSFGQNKLNPVRCLFYTKKLKDRTYEIHMKMYMERGWHVYSERQPEEAVAQPTNIQFNPNPLVLKQGSIREMGRMEKWEDKTTGIKANQYTDSVDFVQIIKIRGNVKTNVMGAITYQTCTDQMCLPPKTEGFIIKIEL